MGYMATAAVSIAPVLTPHTLGVLADNFERVQLVDKARSLRMLQPFVEGVVERCFLPLSAKPKKGSFATRFSKLVTDFGPVRLYLNWALFSALGGNREFLSLYEQLLGDILEPLLKTAREMDMRPELISAAVRDYLKIVRVLGQIESPVPQGNNPNNPNIQQFMDIIDWIWTATRFDYGLTAVFLILEGSIPKPTPTDKVALLSACKKGLVEFAQSTSKVLARENVRRAFMDLETPHIEMEKGLRIIPSDEQAFASKMSFPTPSTRQTEINWLARNKELSDRYGGQWIVLEKEELVASDPDYRKARDVATRRGIKRPFIIFVPPRETGGFMGI